MRSSVRSIPVCPDSEVVGTIPEYALPSSVGTGNPHDIVHLLGFHGIATCTLAKFPKARNRSPNFLFKGKRNLTGHWSFDTKIDGYLFCSCLLAPWTHEHVGVMFSLGKREREEGPSKPRHQNCTFCYVVSSPHTSPRSSHPQLPSRSPPHHHTSTSATNNPHPHCNINQHHDNLQNPRFSNCSNSPSILPVCHFSLLVHFLPSSRFVLFCLSLRPPYDHDQRPTLFPLQGPVTSPVGALPPVFVASVIVVTVFPAVSTSVIVRLWASRLVSASNIFICPSAPVGLFTSASSMVSEVLGSGDFHF